MDGSIVFEDATRPRRSVAMLDVCFCGGERREERGGPFYEALSDVTSKNHSKNKLRKHNRGTMMTQPPFATFELSTLQMIMMDYL